MTSKNNRKLWNKYFVFILIIGLATAVAMQILNSTMTLYLDSLGAGTSFSGMMAAVFALTAGLVRLLSGNLSDRFGRRTFMIAGSFVFAVFVYGFGAVVFLPALFAARTMQGIGFASVSTASGAAVVDVIPESRMGEGLGVYSLATAFSMAAGPMIGLTLAGQGQFHLLYTITAGILLVSFVVSLLTSYEKKMGHTIRADVNHEPAAKTPEEGTGLWRYIEKQAMPASLLFMLFCTAFAFFMIFLPLYAWERGIGSISVFFLVEAIAMFLIRFLTGRIFDKRGPLPVLVPGLVMGALSCLLLLVFKSDSLFLIPAALIGASLGICLPVFNALAVKPVSANRRGAASATFLLFIDVGVGIGGGLWGILLDLTQRNYDLMFAAGAVIMMLTLIISLAVFSGARQAGS